MLGKKDYIDVKISRFPHFFYSSFKRNHYTLIKIYVTHAFLKTVIESIYNWEFKKTVIPEDSKNILGVGRRPEPNIFPITTLIV